MTCSANSKVNGLTCRNLLVMRALLNVHGGCLSEQAGSSLHAV